MKNTQDAIFADYARTRAKQKAARRAYSDALVGALTEEHPDKEQLEALKDAWIDSGNTGD